MLDKIHLPANAEVGLVAATTGAARRDGKEKWDSDSGASFQMSRTQARTIAYKKEPAGMIAEVADGTIMPADVCGTVGGDLDQPDTTTKPVKIISVAYVPRLSWNLLCIHKAFEQWGKPLVHYKTRAVLGFPGEEPLVLNFCFRKELFSATGVRRTPSQRAALVLAAKTAEAIRVETTGR